MELISLRSHLTIFRAHTYKYEPTQQKDYMNKNTRIRTRTETRSDAMGDGMVWVRKSEDEEEENIK